MIFDGSELRRELNNLDIKKGYVKWWAQQNEFDLILNKLNISYSNIKDSLDVSDELYCIFVGSFTNRPISSYLNEFIYGKHTESSVKRGLSSFRKSISSIVSTNYADEEGTNQFIDKLKIEIIPVESSQANLEDVVNTWLSEKFYILNIKNNSHFLAKDTMKNLKDLRDESQKNALNFFASKGDEINSFDRDEKRNLIYFGAPGTGKSFNLNIDKDKLLENYPDNYERVTFHPDYSYANFVGTYKPVPENNSITYKYVPGPFMRILKKALEKPDETFLLLIEEINRANVAATFGEVFQLLDRDKNNESVYPIDTSEDVKSYLNIDKIKLPSNLFIWATMNSADQGVFMMDTAFKRRWDFKYFSINNDEKLIENTYVNLNSIKVNWNTLRKAINDELLSYKINEDKCIGPFFAFNEFMNKEIPTETFKDIFKSKIIMYLFEDAAKSKRNDLFAGAKTDNYVTYSQICEVFDEKGIEIFCDNIKSKFISEEE